MERIERDFAGRKLIIETGRMAKQAAGSTSAGVVWPVSLAKKDWADSE